MDCLAYMYSPQGKYVQTNFDRNLLTKHSEPVADQQVQFDLQKLMEENCKLRDELTARREEQSKTYVPKPLEISEYKTRKVYIDSMLEEAGWTEGKDWINEMELTGMPNQSGKGYADYVLFGDDGRPLAIIEAKRTCEDPAVGRNQAKLYADILEKKYGRRPVVFLTNGFESHIVDNTYPERRVSCIYSKRDLEKLFNLRSMRTSLANITVNKNIAGRYYQEGAVRAVCDAFDKENRRKALLVMATGSGKTRTVISLCDVLLNHGWVKNILFLADRTSLVTQAKRSFVNLLPNLSVTNLCEDKQNYNAHCVFSTYPTMMNCIDSVCDDAGKLYTPGHFDLVICDEAHRSIYNKYQDIFTYFDAPLVGLTATPKDDIDKNTYEIFELPNGRPIYHYDLKQAVADGYLVDFMSIETNLKFLDDGIRYDQLSEEGKQTYEDTFIRQDGDLPDSISSSALNDWVFNADTIRKVLDTFMANGIKIDYGSKIGKTIIFAKNHNHAEKILDIFNKEYPNLVKVYGKPYKGSDRKYINGNQARTKNVDEYGRVTKCGVIDLASGEMLYDFNDTNMRYEWGADSVWVRENGNYKLWYNWENKTQTAYALSEFHNGVALTLDKDMNIYFVNYNYDKISDTLATLPEEEEGNAKTLDDAYIGGGRFTFNANNEVYVVTVDG